MSQVYKPAFIVRGDSITLFVDNKQESVTKGDARYDILIGLSRRLASKDPTGPTLDEWKDALTIKPPQPEPEVVEEKKPEVVLTSELNNELITVNEVTGEVTVDGELLHNTVTARIKEFVAQKLPFQPMLNFLKRLCSNVSYKAQVQLLNFLENRSLPITEDGYVLGYKAVRDNHLDKYSGKYDNSPGAIVSMPRGQVDDDNANQCSKGLHIGGLDYVKMYGSLGGSEPDRIVIVKFDPADAVSVPTDYSHQKLRVCRYEVVGEYTGEMTTPLYTSNNEPFGSTIEDEKDEIMEDKDDGFGDWDNEDNDEDDNWDDDDDDDEGWDDEDEENPPESPKPRHWWSGW